MITRECFIKNVKIMMEVYNKDLNNETVKAYKKILDEKLNDESFEKGCMEIMSSSNKFFPRPGEIIESSRKKAIEKRKEEKFIGNLKKMGLI